MPLTDKKLAEIGEIVHELLSQESGEEVVPYILIVMEVAKPGSPAMGAGGYISNIAHQDAAQECRRTADYLEGVQEEEVKEAIAEAANASKH